MTRLELVPITRDEAQAFVSRHHRTHTKRPVGWRFGVGAASDGAVVGVAMVSNPRARRLNDGWTVEVIRVCVLEGSWSRRERPRVDAHPTQTKLRWERAA